jgi:hypothetical protein
MLGSCASYKVYTDKIQISDGGEFKYDLSSGLLYLVDW